jgi:uncharacterized protein YbaP (TraB family)
MTTDISLKWHLRQWASICLLCIASASVFGDISFVQVKSSLKPPLNQSARARLKLLLENYNRYGGNKAIAIGLHPDGQHIFGMSHGAKSELTASRLATEQCQDEVRGRAGLATECEILVLGDQPVKTGTVLLEGIAEDTPAMAWKVNGPNGDMYFLGTTHMMKPTLQLPPVFDEFFHAVDAVVFETSLSLDVSRQAEFARLTSIDSDEHKELYGWCDKRTLERFVKAQGLPLDRVYAQTPIMNAVQITQLRTAAIGYSSDTGVEMRYTLKARKFRKPILELETPIEALSTLFGLPLELQSELFINTIQDLDGVAPGVQLIIENWLQGDVQRVYEQTVEDMVAEPHFAEIATGMLDKRNARWMEKIDRKLGSEGSFVVMVGSAHFGGEKGLLNLLKERGLNPVQYTWGGAPIDSAPVVSD